MVASGTGQKRMVDNGEHIGEPPDFIRAGYIWMT
jgi:hypothetical protein